MFEKRLVHTDKDSQYKAAFAVFHSDIFYTDGFWCLDHLKSATSYK